MRPWFLFAAALVVACCLIYPVSHVGSGALALIGLFLALIYGPNGISKHR